MYQQKRVSLVLILRADCSLFALKPARSSPYLPPSMDIQQPTDAPISATVRFQPDHPGGDTYTGHYCPPLPGGIADASFYAHVLSSSVPGRTSDLVSIVQRYRLSGEVDDAYQAWAGQVPTFRSLRRQKIELAKGRAKQTKHALMKRLQP
jgi:hypothetical protein